MQNQRVRKSVGPLRLRNWLVALAAVGLSFSAFAQVEVDDSSGTSSVSPFHPFEQAVGQDWMGTNLSSYEELTSTAVSLIEYLKAHIDPVPRDQIEKEIPRYNRREAFGGWVNHDPRENCLDTRNEVLVRDAENDAAVTYNPSAKCVVAKGHWVDPYSGRDYKTARSMQVDHVVPLKNAYVSGAYRWTRARRCHYANFLGNDFHLLAVSGHENMSKSNRGPEDYMPPEPSYQCTYLSLWLKIKAIWELDLSEREADTIQDLAREYGCKTKSLTISGATLRAQRTLSQQPIEKCSKAQ